MKIIAKRPFISSRAGIGNVPEGRVLDMDDGYAASLIKAGLAEAISAAPSLRANRQTSFIRPVEASAANGSPLPAAQASSRQTVTKSGRGVKKTTAAR